jgi:hypothetical protein
MPDNRTIAQIELDTKEWFCSDYDHDCKQHKVALAVTAAGLELLLETPGVTPDTHLQDALVSLGV